MRWLLLLALVPASPQDDYVPLFANGGFEQGLDGWRALNLSGSCEYQVVPEPNGGDFSLRITRGEGERSDWLKRNADLPTDSGSVLLRLWHRTEGAGSAQVSGYFWDADGDTLGGQRLVVEIGESAEWAESYQAWPVPEGAVGFGVNVRTTAPGTVLIDDVVAEYRGEVSEPRPSLVLANPTFDEGTEGWSLLEGGSDKAEVGWDRKQQALRIVRAGQRRFPEDGVEALAERAAREERVRLSVRLRVSGDAVGRVTLQARSRSGAVLASERVELAAGKRKRYETVQVDLDVPRGTTRFALLLTVGGKGEVLFDDLELVAR